MTVLDELRAGAEDFLLLIISSPSGAGKTTLCRKLRAEFPSLTFSVSHTTRKPRPGEQDGREYHFVDRPTFERLVEAQAFAEWAEVHGNLYGTSFAEIERARTNEARGIIFDIDYQGARQIRQRVPDAAAVFILPPSFTVLEQRLRNRASDDDETVRRRLAKARTEIEHYALFDYLIVNEDLDRAYDQLRSIVLAEGARRLRKATLAEVLLRTGALPTG
ncbi:MAG: guanylate kinase [Myxococcales bacterium]|nr:guanylate kinase [Myxococcales bacterium]